MHLVGAPLLQLVDMLPKFVLPPSKADRQTLPYRREWTSGRRTQPSKSVVAWTASRVPRPCPTGHLRHLSSRTRDSIDEVEEDVQRQMFLQKHPALLLLLLGRLPLCSNKIHSTRHTSAMLLHSPCFSFLFCDAPPCAPPLTDHWCW